MRELEEVRRVKASAEYELLKRPGVTGIEVGYKIIKGKKTDELAIRILVEKKKDVPKDQMIPSTINSVKTDVIERTFSKAIPIVSVKDLENKKLEATGADTQPYNPLVGGIGIGSCRLDANNNAGVGTLGAIVVNNKTNERMVLSNAHVLAWLSSSVNGDKISQPSRADGALCNGDSIGELVNHVDDGTVDCALASIVGSRTALCEIVEIGDVTGISTVDIGDLVRKRGRSTRLTIGDIESIDQTLVIDGTTYMDQIGIEPDISRNRRFLEDGDSGSVVVNNESKVVGLLWATSGFGHGSANKIQNVLTALKNHGSDVSICI